MRYYMAPKCRQSSYLYRCNSLQLRVLHRRKRGFTEGNFSLAAAEEADRHIGRLVEGLEERGLLEAVHIVIVSDHGMTPVSEERVIYLDDYMDLANVNVVGSGSGAPIWPQPGDEDDVYASLATAHPNMSVFKKEDIPERFH